jgi:hypothetical protein
MGRQTETASGRKEISCVGRIRIAPWPVSCDNKKTIRLANKIKATSLRRSPPKRLAASSKDAGSLGFDTLLEPELPSVPLPFSLSISNPLYWKVTSCKSNVNLVGLLTDFNRFQQRRSMIFTDPVNFFTFV